LSKSIAENITDNEANFIKNRNNELKLTIIHPPEIIHLKSLLQDFTADFHKWECLISIGDIYRKGAFPRFLPNNDLAIHCFKIGAMCPNGNISGLSQAKYIEAMTEQISILDNKGVPLPTKYGDEACKLAESRIHSIPFEMIERPRNVVTTAVQDYDVTTAVQDYDVTTAVPDNAVTTQTYNLIGDFNEYIFDEPVTIAPLRANLRFNNESQNVHDHAVMSIAKLNLKTITVSEQANTNHDNAATLMNVNEIIKSNTELTSQQKSNALLVLKKLDGINKTGFGVTEQDVLTIVVNRIMNEKNDVIKQNLSETLGKQIATGVENGSVVCSTGKILRILGTLDGADDVEQIRPIWALKEEIGTLAASIRDKHVSQLNCVEKEAYDRGELVDVEAQMKTEFNQSAEQIYFEKLNMSKAIVGPIIKLYEDAF
jgi:hypothetical protein